MGPPPMGEPKIKKCLSIDPPVVVKKPPIVEDSDNTLKLMSYNVDFKNESKSAFKNRLNIVNIIARENPDIIGLQEAKWFNRSNEPLKSMNILKNMGGFAIKNDGGDPNYTSMVLFNQNKFILVSQLDKNLHNRGVNVVKLEHIKTKKHIIVINAHLDHMWNGANFKGINEIRKTIELLYNATEEIKYNKGDHIIFMGDTNEFYEEFTDAKKYDFPIKLDNNIKFWMVNAGKTCCRNNPKGTLDYKSDVFGTNNQNLLTTLDSGKRLGEWGISGSNPLSDHTWITAKYNLDGVIADVDDMDEKEVWAYDFDGVIHKLMNPGEDFKTNHRNPDHFKLQSNFVKDYKYLIPYLFKHTIDDIKKGILKGIKIKIVSANGEIYTKPIFNLLKSQGINLKQTHYKFKDQHTNIDKNDIIMRVSPKIDMLEKLKVTKFVDDSCYNIKAIYNAYKDNGKIPTLKTLIFAIPETESYYNVKLSKTEDIEICRGDSEIWGKNLLENKLKNVNLLYSDKVAADEKVMKDKIIKLKKELEQLENVRDRLNLGIQNMKKYNLEQRQKYDKIFKEKQDKIEQIKKRLGINIYKGTFTNVGNSCYINTTLQLLFNINVLRDEILKIDQTYIDSLVNNNENDILRIIYNVFDLLNKNTKSINLEKYFLPSGESYYNAIIRIFKFRCKENEDAEEALNNILNTLFEIEVLKDFSKKIEIETEGNKFCKNDDTVLTSKNKDIELRLPIDKNLNDISLYDLIDDYTKYEYIDPPDDIKLDACKDSEGNKYPLKATKANFKITPMNKNILIQLKRFDYSTGVPIKLHNTINIEDEIILDDKVYKLKGMAIHIDSPKHYVYVILVGKNKYIYNDSEFSEYKSDVYNYKDNSYILNYELIENIDESKKLELYLNKIARKFNKLENVKFVLDNIYNINNSVIEFKKELDIINRLITKGVKFEDPDMHKILDDINDKVRRKQERLKKYEILEKPFDFNIQITELDISELENSLTNNGSVDLKSDIKFFKYQKPNSASASVIFRAYWENKKCFIKSFTIPGYYRNSSPNKNLEYEQKLYNYINERNKQLTGEFSDNFVNVYRVFKVNRINFINFYNDKTLQGSQLKIKTNPGAFNDMKYGKEPYIYFIVTEDIGGSTVEDFFDQQCKDFSNAPGDKIKQKKIRNEIMHMLFELIYGLYLLNTRLKVIHNDNHFGNLLIKEEPRDKIYTINNTEYVRRKKYRVCIYDFDLSYFQGNINPDSRTKENNRTNQINIVDPLTDINKGRDIYTIGNSLYTFSMWPKYEILSRANFNRLFKNDRSGEYNIMRILFETDTVIDNLEKKLF